MSCVAHTAQIDLRFRDAASQLVDFGVGVGPSNFARASSSTSCEDRIGIERQTQTMPARIARRTEAALRGFWAGASPSISAVGLNFGVARQAAFSPLARVVSTT